MNRLNCVLCPPNLRGVAGTKAPANGMPDAADIGGIGVGIMTGSSNE